MKKILNFIIVTWLLLSSLLIANDYMILEFPTGIDIQLNTTTDQDETMDIILDTCKKYDVDIYKLEYLGVNEKKELYNVYYTNTSLSSLLSFLSIENGIYTDGVISTKYSDNKPYIKAFNLDRDYVFYDLKYSIKDTTLEGVYKIISTDDHKVTEFISELKDHNVPVDILGKGTSVQTNEHVELIIFFMIITLLLSFYRIIQNQKDISIKKLNGYTNVNIMVENNLNLIKRFVMLVCISSALNILILLLMKEYDSLSDYLFIYGVLQLISLIILLILNNIANIYLLTIHPVLGIKSFSKDFIIDISSMVIKIGTIVMIILYLLSLSKIRTELNEVSSNIKNWENTKNLAYTITQGYYPSTIEEEKKFEEKFKYLFTKLNDCKAAILLDATSFQLNVPRGNNNLWSYDSSKVIVNRNYLKDSNISSSIIKQMTTWDISDTILLIPSSFKTEETKIKDDFFENLPLDHKDKHRIKTLVYEENISIFTADLDVSTRDNIVQNPIIVVDDNNFEGYYYLGIFSSGGVHIPVNNIHAPYKEIQGNLVEAKLDSTIKITPLVYSRYSEKISEFNATIVKISLQLFLLFMVGSTLIYNSIIIFITKNSKEIAIKKMMGFRSIEIYATYLKDVTFIWVAASICIYIYLNNVTFIPVLSACIVFELLLTFILIMIQERKNILSILKGNNERGA